MTMLRHILQVCNCQNISAQLCTIKVQTRIKSKLVRLFVSSVAGAEQQGRDDD